MPCVICCLVFCLESELNPSRMATSTSDNPVQDSKHLVKATCLFVLPEKFIDKLPLWIQNAIDEVFLPSFACARQESSDSIYIILCSNCTDFSRWSGAYRRSRCLCQYDCILPAGKQGVCGLFQSQSSYQASSLWNVLTPMSQITLLFDLSILLFCAG